MCQSRRHKGRQWRNWSLSKVAPPGLTRQNCIRPKAQCPYWVAQSFDVHHSRHGKPTLQQWPGIQRTAWGRWQKSRGEGSRDGISPCYLEEGLLHSEAGQQNWWTTSSSSSSPLDRDTGSREDGKDEGMIPVQVDRWAWGSGQRKVKTQNNQWQRKQMRWRNVVLYRWEHSDAIKADDMAWNRLRMARLWWTKDADLEQVKFLYLLVGRRTPHRIIYTLLCLFLNTLWDFFLV